MTGRNVALDGFIDPTFLDNMVQQERQCVVDHKVYDGFFIEYNVDARIHYNQTSESILFTLVFE